jgi:hypothetical protein
MKNMKMHAAVFCIQPKVARNILEQEYYEQTFF